MFVLKRNTSLAPFLSQILYKLLFHTVLSRQFYLSLEVGLIHIFLPGLTTPPPTTHTILRVLPPLHLLKPSTLNTHTFWYPHFISVASGLKVLFFSFSL